MATLTFKVLSSSTPTYLNDLIQPAVPVRPLQSSDAPLLSAARTRTEFARWAFSFAAAHTWNSLPSDIRSCHTLHTFKNTTKHTCSDSLNLKPPSPPYPLQDFKALYKCCIIIIIIITMLGSAIQSIMVTWWQSNRLHWHLVRKQQWSRVINYYHSAIKTLYFCYLFDQIRLYTVVFLQ